MITECSKLDKIKRESGFREIIIDKENTSFSYNNINYDVLNYKGHEEKIYYILAQFVRLYYLADKTTYFLRIIIDYKNNTIIFNLANDTTLRQYRFPDLDTALQCCYFRNSMDNLMRNINKEFDKNPIIFQAPNISLFNIEFHLINRAIKISYYDFVDFEDIDINSELKPV